MNGKNDAGKQKYKCKKCNFCFINKERNIQKIRGEKLFNDWLIEGYSCRQLGVQKHKYQKDILQYIRNILDTNLIQGIDEVFEDIEHVMIDGTWITKEICLIIYYEYVQKKVIWFGFYDGEKYEYIRDDLKILKESFGYKIRSFTVDGGKQIKKAIQEVYPEVKLQRCLTHIQRQIQNYISKYPKSECGRELKRIVRFKNFLDEKKFTDDFCVWKSIWFDFLEERSYKGEKSWYKHKRLRQARSHLQNALPYMFFYLKDNTLKKSSNDGEGFFAILYDQIYNHRGLKKERLISFISLWIYNRNLKQK